MTMRFGVTPTAMRRDVDSDRRARDARAATMGCASTKAIDAEPGNGRDARARARAGDEATMTDAAMIHDSNDGEDGGRVGDEEWGDERARVGDDAMWSMDGRAGASREVKERWMRSPRSRGTGKSLRGAADGGRGTPVVSGGRSMIELRSFNDRDRDVGTLDDAVVRTRGRQDRGLPPTPTASGRLERASRSSLENDAGGKISVMSWLKDVGKGGRGANWQTPTTASTMLAHARQRALHKRTLSLSMNSTDDLSAFADRVTRCVSTGGTPVDVILEDARAYTADDFLSDIENVVTGMRERQDIVRRLTVETIDACKTLVELEAPVEAMLRLKEVTMETVEDELDENSTILSDGSSSAVHLAASLADEDGFEISSAILTSPSRSITLRSPPESSRRVGEISLEDVEAELQDVRRIAFESAPPERALNIF